MTKHDPKNPSEAENSGDGGTDNTGPDGKGPDGKGRNATPNGSQQKAAATTGGADGHTEAEKSKVVEEIDDSAGEGVKPFVRFTLRQKVFVNLIFILLMAVGTFCVFDLPVERYPNVQMGKVVISAFLPGASADEVEALVTRKVEDSLDDLEQVEYIRSRSFRERSSIMVKFLDDTDYDKLYDELRFKVLNIQNDLPQNMDPPSFFLIEVSQWMPVLNVNLVGERSNRALTLMAEEMQIPLRQIPGVQEVKIDGEYTREFHVNLDPSKHKRFGLTFDQVSTALDCANVSVPAGDFNAPSGEYVIVVDERFRTREDVVNAIIRRDADGSFVRVADVITDAEKSYRDPVVIASVNGRDTISIKIIKTPEGNALDIGEAVEGIVADFSPKLSKEGVDVVLTQDQRTYIEDNINTLGSNLFVGIVLVCGIIWLVMGFRNAMLTTVGVPFSFMVTMIIMWMTDNSLNEITLFSFVLVSGIIVDDAIVVVENIFRHVQEGKPLKQAVVDGTAEVMLPVVAATSTTVAAFLPMLIMTGSTGEFFALVPKAVSFAILASLVECLVILPPHFLDWPGAKKLTPQNIGKHFKDPKFLTALQRIADAILVRCMRHPWLSLGSVFIAFVLSVVILVVSLAGVAPLIRIKFFPDDYNAIYVDIQGPTSTAIGDTGTRVKDIAAQALKLGPGMVRSVSGLAGMNINEDYENVYGPNRGHLVLELPAKEMQQYADAPTNDPALHLEYIRKALENFADKGWNVRVWPEKGGPPTGKAVNIRVLGPDHQAVLALEKNVLEFIKNNEKIGPWLTDLEEDTGTPNRIFRFSPIPERVAEYGLNTTQVAGLAGSVLDGRFVGEFRMNDEDVDIRVKVAPEYLREPEDALDIPVVEGPVGPVRLGDLCTVNTYSEPGQLNRFQGQRAITVTANLKPGAPVNATSIVHDVREYYRSIAKSYPGATINFAGEYESTGRSFQSLAYAFLIAIMVIYIILACQFQSYVQPAIILSAVIFALTGVILGTFFTRSMFTVNSFIATVGVTGVVVNDSLVLLDFVNKLYARGMTRLEAVREGVRIRLRPILLTTLTTTLGLLPMALGIPYYSLVWGTMATTFVTGLCTATTLTLFIMPLEWALVMRFVEWKDRRKTEREQKMEAHQATAD